MDQKRYGLRGAVVGGILSLIYWVPAALLYFKIVEAEGIFEGAIFLYVIPAMMSYDLSGIGWKNIFNNPTSPSNIQIFILVCFMTVITFILPIIIGMLIGRAYGRKKNKNLISNI
jgi:hypothetical protein